MKIYIASSWKNQHAVEMMTALLKEQGHEVASFVENAYGEGYTASSPMDFEKWVNTDNGNKSFEYDTINAMTCDVLIYVSPSGKDAAAEVGMCYGQRLKGRTIPIIGLYAKGEDFGLMRKMFDFWVERYPDVLDTIKRLQQ